MNPTFKLSKNYEALKAGINHQIESEIYWNNEIIEAGLLNEPMIYIKGYNGKLDNRQ